MAGLHSAFIVITVLCLGVNAKVAVFNQCHEVPQELCTVSEVRITPGTGKDAIQLRVGTNASLSFDFTPNFTASKLKTMAYYQGIAYADLSSDNACLFTTCPTVPGVRQTLDLTLPLGKKLPTGKYLFQWKVWNEDNANELCCFMTTIKLKPYKKSK